jgi:polyhydroxyalkanoate synthase subunit PhaC
MLAASMAGRDDDRLASLTLLAAEVDFTEAGELSIFIDDSQLAYLEDLTWEQGYLDGRQMSGAFTLLNSNDLIWSRIVRQYLMAEPQKLTDLTAWNADTTRLPHRMHTEYLRNLYLNNDLASGRLRYDGRALALADIRAPMFLVGTERDHVAPWKSVYMLHLYADADITFCLTSGGHNVGIVNPPQLEGRAGPALPDRHQAGGRPLHRPRPVAGAQRAAPRFLVAGMGGVAGGAVGQARRAADHRQQGLHADRHGAGCLRADEVVPGSVDARQPGG